MALSSTKDISFANIGLLSIAHSVANVNEKVGRGFTFSSGVDDVSKKVCMKELFKRVRQLEKESSNDL